MIAELEERFPEMAEALGPRNLEILFRATTPLELPAGRKVIRDRMPVDSLYLILDGEVSISVEEGGKSIHLGEVGPGQWLGEVSVLSGEFLASSTVTTATPVRMLRLRHQAFEDLIATNYEIASVLLRHFVALLADRLRTSVRSFGAVQDGTEDGQRTATPVAESRGWIRSIFSSR
ncbi:MAG TPA: cyclic nucleotide-binding domain-containing protein [Burkholderiales bacterium]|jgi:CRP-like cAMP-binding protein|nr:cyclic nucleotide-binding domain-containing protein [Burkholderiales bacterium]